jgi:hypothetical protein
MSLGTPFTPFNFKPYSVSVKTSSYTIPANYYALASVTCRGNSYVTIDGTNCIHTTLNAFTGGHVVTSGEIWLPTGAVVSGSGTWRATITLFAVAV